ncbi:myosin-XVIIIa isoform 1, partial [Danaus plexippus plexippus]
EELETLRVKLEKAENERSHYKNETEQLETKKVRRDERHSGLHFDIYEKPK